MNIKDKIGLLCIGQCGANIGQAMSNINIDRAYINTSREDLDVINATNKYHIKNGIGCAKDRKVALKLLKDDCKNIIEFIKNNFSKKEMIIVVFSAGGGTGSGISPTIAEMIQLLLKKKVALITVLPSEKESLQAHINAYECFAEINAKEKFGTTFVIDNNNNDKMYLNKKFSSIFSTIFDYKKHNSEKGNIDEKEVMKMLETKGMTFLAKCENNTDIIENAIENGIFTKMENDNVAKYVMFSGNKFDDDKFIRKFGKFIDKFENRNKEFNFLMVSGLTLPLKRIKEMQEKIMKEKEILKNKKTQALDKLNLFEDEDDEVQEIEQEEIGQEEIEQDKIDKFFGKILNNLK